MHKHYINIMSDVMFKHHVLPASCTQPNVLPAWVNAVLWHSVSQSVGRNLLWIFIYMHHLPSVLWHCWLGRQKWVSSIWTCCHSKLYSSAWRFLWDEPLIDFRFHPIMLIGHSSSSYHDHCHLTSLLCSCIISQKPTCPTTSSLSDHRLLTLSTTDVIDSLFFLFLCSSAFVFVFIDLVFFLILMSWNRLLG